MARWRYMVLGFIGMYLSTLSVVGQALNFERVDQMGSPQFAKIDRSYALTTDVDGNVFITGYFQGTADFDPGPGVVNVTSINTVIDAYVAKYDSTGTFQWVAHLAGINVEIGESVAVDDSGNVFVGGRFGDTTDFDPGPGVVNLVPNSNSDVFVLKLSSNGQFVWVRQISASTALDMVTDTNGNVYTVGNFTGTMDFDPGPGVDQATSNGSTDFYIWKLSPGGNLVWGHSFGWNNADRVQAVDIDPAGNLYMTGFFAGTVDFNPGFGVFNLTSSSGCYVLKLTGGGAFVWARTVQDNGAGGASISEGFDVAADALGNVHITGNFNYSVDFDPGPGIALETVTTYADLFVFKLDSQGNYCWAYTVGGNDYDVGLGIDVDRKHNVYVAGTYSNIVDFDNGPNSTILTSPNSTNTGFIMLMDSAGTFLWAGQVGGTEHDELQDVMLDRFNNLYITGSFEYQGDFDPGPGTATLSTGFLQGADIYVAKYGLPCFPTVGADTLDACDSYTAPDGQVYTASGQYTALLNNVDGCDSTLTIDLTIISSQSDAIAVTSCDSYTAPDGQVYTMSGQYVAVLSTVAGCDSTITIELTITNSTTSALDTTSCGSYTAPDGQVYASSGQYTAVIPGVNGCDSTIAIDLTVLPLDSTTIDTVACVSYTAPDGQVYTASGQYVASIPSATSCDSTLLINLTVQPVNTTVQAQAGALLATAANATYQWLDCDNGFSPIAGATDPLFAPAQNGNYAVAVTQAGCVDTSACQPVVNSSAPEWEALPGLTVAPVPTDGWVQVSLGTEHQRVDVVVRDVTGKLVHQQAFVRAPFEVFVPGPAGYYLLEVTADQQRAFRKLIKQ